MNTFSTRIRSATDHSPAVAGLVFGVCAFIPNHFISLVASALYSAFGSDGGDGFGSFTASLTFIILGKIILIPFVETLLLGAVLWLLCKFTRNKLLLCSGTACLFGALHIVNGPMAIFGAAWAFFVFSWAYLHWAQHSKSHAIVVAWWAHSVNNALAFAAGLLGI